MKDFDSAVTEKEQINLLIKQAQNGNQDAFEELRNLYIPLLESQSAKHILPDMTSQDIEDLKQEALIVFCNSIRNYNFDFSEVEFGLYAKICIENGLVTYVRSFMRRRQSRHISLIDSEKRQSKDLLQTLIDKENRDELVRAIRNNLSEYENRVWWLYVSGMTVSEITEVIGNTDAKSVSNAIYRIRKKLRNNISEQN